MKLLSRVFAFYINSSIHVAFAVLALFAITVLEFSIAVHKVVYGFVFFASLTGYNFVKYAKIAGLHHRSLTKSLRLIQLFSALCFVVLVYFALQLSLKVLLLTAGFGLATLLYAIPVVRSKNLRNFSGVKIFIVAFVWAGVTVILPFVASNSEITFSAYLTFFQRILIVVALILPFEIRDIPYDALNLKTLPQLVGVKKTKLIGFMLLGLGLGFELFKTNFEISHTLSFIVFCVLLGGLIAISKPHQNRYFASFWVEGLPILWLLLFIIFKNN